MVSQSVAEKVGISQRRTDKILLHAISTIADCLCDHESVTLENFGKFEVKLRKGWSGRHPKSGDHVRIHERYRVYFRPGKMLKRRIAGITGRRQK